MKTTLGGAFRWTDEGWSRHVENIQRERQKEIEIKKFLKGVFAKLSESEINAICAAADYGWLDDLDEISTPDLKKSDAMEYF